MVHPPAGRKQSGFTLIELIVVMALLSMLLFFAIPRLDVHLFSNDARKFSTWLLLTVKSLKEQSQQNGIPLILYVDMDNDAFWTGMVMDDESKEKAKKENQYKLPDDMQLVDVQFPGMEPTSSGIVEIYFYPKGYSDKAVIHIRDGDQKKTSYVVEPFLSEVKIYDRDIVF